MEPRPFYPRVLRSRSVFENRWVRLLEKQVELERGGALQSFYSLDPPDYVCAIGTTNDGRFPLVRQYRPAVEALTWEFPSGTLEPGEEAATCARRELLEETGYVSAGNTLLTTLTTDIGRLGNRIFGFHCRGCAPAFGWRPEEGIEVRVVTRAELGLLIEREEFNFALHLAVWAAYLRVVEGSGGLR
jgi:ADP-ribose pyrophosphatase